MPCTASRSRAVGNTLYGLKEQGGGPAAEAVPAALASAAVAVAVVAPAAIITLAGTPVPVLSVRPRPAYPANPPRLARALLTAPCACCACGR